MPNIDHLPPPAELAGPVSALSLSYDHTYIAVGHAHGHISLYDVSRPQAPARSVPPTSLPAVASGRREGHIQGAPILSLGFVGARHTAIVSADEKWVGVLPQPWEGAVS